MLCSVFINLLFDILASRVRELLKEMPIFKGHLETVAAGALGIGRAPESSRSGELTNRCRAELQMNFGMTKTRPSSLPDGDDR